MELRSAEELMDLLYACPPDARAHALRTAALLRRHHPADKELQVAGLVHGIGGLLRPGGRTGASDPAADAVHALLGERVSRLVRRHAAPAGGRLPDESDEDALSLRQAAEEARSTGFDAGVLEDWRTVLELLAAGNYRLRTVD
ncbi:hypothetical protein ACFY3J_04635 [Streptomyces sp. NPDC001231]|uniref:hypothetical protein n=1 Tax=Streptomyces sp. NPDC001231 TaxID=3364549 RepID=UPI0036842163